MWCRCSLALRFARIAIIPVLFLSISVASVYGQRGSGSNVNYIDSAIPANVFRLRFDGAFDNPVPDRAEFFYPKCGCFRTASPPFQDEDAPGPRLPETGVDYQEFSLYFERVCVSRFSTFIEVPFRFLDPEQNANAQGLSDIHLGFKGILQNGTCGLTTFQLRTYLPTGDGIEGLGTDHISLEPALLMHRRLTNRLTLEAELREWIAVGGTDFSGSVIRYGVGLSYDDIFNRYTAGDPVGQVTPVIEFVGWTVLDGKKSPPPATPIDAAGDTILNAKIGVRIGLTPNSKAAISYGRAISSETWYEHVFRVEYIAFL